MPRNTALKICFNLIIIAVLACTPSAIFAQHGGGGHGGGGGFHGGGGSHASSGGGFRGTGSGSATRASGPSMRSSAPAASAPRYNGGNAYAGPGQNSYRAGSGSSRPAVSGAGHSAGSTPAPSDGQWHSFGEQRAMAPNEGMSFATGISRATAPGGASRAGAVTRSFVGQGSEIRETTPRSGISRPIMSGSQPGGWRPGGLHAGGFGSFGSVGRFPTAGLRFGVGNFGFRRFPVFRPFGGFGFGLGFGFGFGWNSCWAWDPFCFNSIVAFPPYGYYAYPPSVGYGPNYDPYYDPNYVSNQPDYNSPSGSSGSLRSNAANPSSDTTASTPSGGSADTEPVIIYLKDGTSFSPSDYWLTDKQLHYVLGGAEITIDIDRVDLPRSNDENRKNGVRFRLKSSPNPSAAPSNGAPAATPPRTDDNVPPAAGE